MRHTSLIDPTGSGVGFFGQQKKNRDYIASSLDGNYIVT